MANDLEALIKQLSVEIQELEVQKVRIEATLEEKRRLQKSLNELSNKSTIQMGTKGSKTKTIASLNSQGFEYSGKQFSKAGPLLDFLGIPHYFSKENQGGDEAVRQIVRWARNNPVKAREVMVILANGSRLNLLDAISRL